MKTPKYMVWFQLLYLFYDIHICSFRFEGYLMTAATVCAAFAYYVIYSNKEASNKKHLTTLHGKLGIAVMIGYTLLAVGGAVGKTTI